MYQKHFTIDGHQTIWNSAVTFPIDTTYRIIFEINYFYIRPDNPDVLGFLIDNLFAQPGTSKEIISKHCIEAQFSLDNGLYKNAVLNFGTALEELLNKGLDAQTLNVHINQYQGAASRDFMHDIRNLRNVVHPTLIANNSDINKESAIAARNKFEIIMSAF